MQNAPAICAAAAAVPGSGEERLAGGGAEVQSSRRTRALERGVTETTVGTSFDHGIEVEGGTILKKLLGDRLTIQ